jgi:hypothetical protein
LIDYQDTVIEDVWEQDHRVIELHTRTLATAAVGFDIPVVLSTVAVELGVNSPILPALTEAVPGVRSSGSHRPGQFPTRLSR